MKDYIEDLTEQVRHRGRRDRRPAERMTARRDYNEMLRKTDVPVLFILGRATATSPPRPPRRWLNTEARVSGSVPGTHGFPR